MINQSMHALLLALVGGYILYSAGHLLKNLLSGVGDIPFAAAIAAISVFIVAGIGVLIYAWKIYRKTRKSDADEDEEE